MKASTAGRLNERLRTVFPDREFFMRSQGQVRFIKISSKMQAYAACVAVLMLGAWLISMAAMAISQYTSNRDRVALLNREAKVQTAESRVTNYRDGIKSVANDLARRQEFIEKMVQAHVGDLPADAKSGEKVSDSTSEAQRTVDKVSAALPEASGLARMEARQLAFVEKLTRFADRRAASADQRIRRLGLSPESMLTTLEDNTAQGGPFQALTASANGSLDQRFQRLGISLARMSALERGLAGIPQVLPASLEFISSGFGYRSDPFNGSAAFHSGLDFKGPYGASIYAAAKGVVSFVGAKQGYGYCVEIDHGNGLLTRYAHMSAFRTVVGKPVTPGEVIGAIGNSGRSTGPHLHFEVRVNDRAVNPRPFLEAARHVSEEITANPVTSSGG